MPVFSYQRGKEQLLCEESTTAENLPKLGIPDFDLHHCSTADERATNPTLTRHELSETYLFSWTQVILQRVQQTVNSHRGTETCLEKSGKRAWVFSNDGLPRCIHRQSLSLTTDVSYLCLDLDALQMIISETARSALTEEHNKQQMPRLATSWETSHGQFNMAHYSTVSSNRNSFLPFSPHGQNFHLHVKKNTLFCWKEGKHWRKTSVLKIIKQAIKNLLLHQPDSTVCVLLLHYTEERSKY